MNIDRHLRAARRRNRLIETRMGRLQVLGLVALATLAFAHLTDRAAQGVTDCAALELAQCPGFLR